MGTVFDVPNAESRLHINETEPTDPPGAVCVVTVTVSECITGPPPVDAVFEPVVTRATAPFEPAADVPLIDEKGPEHTPLKQP
jgi:hypothetical protein